MGLMLSALRASIEAQQMQSGQVWSYALLDGSQLVDDCPICDRIPIVRPLRGTFQLRLLQQGPLFFNYALENLSLTAGDTNGANYKVVGSGTYRIGGEVGLQQFIFLEVSIDNGVTNTLCLFTNAVIGVSRRWPMIQVGVDQTNGTATQQYHLELDTAPLREIWFSTSQAFKAGLWNAPTNLVSAGDFVSSIGRVVKRNQELTRNLGIMPPVPDLGLKDADVLPGGEIAFSIETPAFSETLGVQLHPGDLLSDQGRLLRTNQQLIAAFGPQPPTTDVGLSALQVMDDGEIYFSVQTNFFSKTLSRQVQPGDLLTDLGAVVKANADLVKPFMPANPTNNCGLSAVYVWPSGEIWFSTRDGFYDSNSNFYAPGDLLSDQGYVVYRNSELLAAFQPPGGGTDFGLDALFIVTDAADGRPGNHLGSAAIDQQPTRKRDYPEDWRQPDVPTGKSHKRGRAIFSSQSDYDGHALPGRGCPDQSNAVILSPSPMVSRSGWQPRAGRLDPRGNRPVFGYHLWAPAASAKPTLEGDHCHLSSRPRNVWLSGRAR